MNCSSRTANSAVPSTQKRVKSVVLKDGGCPSRNDRFRLRPRPKYAVYGWTPDKNRNEKETSTAWSIPFLALSLYQEVSSAAPWPCIDAVGRKGWRRITRCRLWPCAPLLRSWPSSTRARKRSRPLTVHPLRTHAIEPRVHRRKGLDPDPYFFSNANLSTSSIFSTK